MAALRNKWRKVEKEAWEWSESIDCNAIKHEHLEKAYRIYATCSEKGNHRKNCKFNPNCMACLGEKFWMKELPDDIWCDIKDPAEQKREEGSFVGLKNLGATCYVNTLVQVWFHNDEFRSALYSWIPLDESAAITNPGKDLDQEKMVTEDISTSAEEICRENKQCNEKQVAENKTTSQLKNNPEAGDSKSVQEGITEDMPRNEPNKLAITIPPVPLCNPWTDNKTAKSFCHHLQLLLAQLQYTSRRFVDPAPFVESLGLDKELQQDAQEFSKLFMSLLEDTLSQQPNPVLRNIVQQQFGGSYVYITRCKNCGKQSQRSSAFYELDLNIHGNTNLSQCIKEYLKEEDLHGDNQYHCSFCVSKQNATRHIKLQELPPVLNLQLLRFVFDRKTGYKKKLSNSIWFPEVLNMKEYVDAEMEGCFYDLSAVLIHRGPGAYSGHYIAHIKDKKSGLWYRFNDEATEKMKGKSLNLESEEDPPEVINGATASKRPKMSKGSSSKDAYMLVYRQRGDEKQAVAQEPPPNIQLMVAEDNSKMDEWTNQVERIRDKMALFGKQRQREVKKILQILSVAEGSTTYDWIVTDWLRRWLNAECRDIGPINNSSLLCQHRRLHPDKVLCAKRISTKAATFFYKRYGGSTRLTSENSFCVDCVKERCRSLQYSSHLTEDQKYFVKALKVSCENNRTGFWVSKQSLHRWKALALEHREPLAQNSNSPSSIEPKSNCPTPEETSKSITCPSEAVTRDNSTSNSVNDTSEMEIDGKKEFSGSERDSIEMNNKEKLRFNEDLLCEHGCLSTSTVSKRLVTNEVWKRLRFYFPEAPEFHWDQTACPLCTIRDEEEARRIKDLKELASQQKSILGCLYSEKGRPEFDEKISITAYALSRTFYEDWKKFVRYPPSRRVQPSSIANKKLICPHEKFLYHPRCGDNDGASSALVYLWGMEWEILSQTFGYDVEIKIISEISDETCNYNTIPDCCVDCNAALIVEQFNESEEYEHAEIYIRKISEEQTREDVHYIENHSPLENSNESSKCERPEFVAGSTSKISGERRRRSSRHRKQRGEVAITVDSCETVRDLKLKLMKLFSVLPLDQQLRVNGQVLECNDSTLGAAGVRPGSILLLKIDEPQDGIFHEEISAASRKPEEGFKDVNVYKRAKPLRRREHFRSFPSWDFGIKI